MTGACARKPTHGAHAQHAVINKAMSADMALPPPAAPFDLHPEALCSSPRHPPTKRGGKWAKAKELGPARTRILAW